MGDTPRSSGAPASEQELLELEAVLSSPIFQRAPGLAKFLSYICHKHFAGEAAQIKEYNIAVEALGRPPDFDQKVDAIVRVEANRLRKRLREYYETEGSSHPLQITIPPGQYAPVFMSVGSETPKREEVEPSPTSEAAGPAVDAAGIPRSESGLAQPSLWRNPLAWVVGALIVIGMLVIAATRLAPPREEPVLANSATAIPEGDELRILAGSSASRYVDKRGYAWMSDRYFTGGDSMRSPAVPIARTRDPEIFRTRREGDFRYDIPVKPGVYEVRLWFAETVFGPGNIAGGGESDRLFNVDMNGRRVLTQLDVLSNAGGSNTADAVVFKDVSPAPDGQLHLQFTQFKERPILSGIEVLPGIPGRMRPVRMVVGEAPYTDSQGQHWDPDCCVQGGRTITRPTAVAGTRDPELYRAERFGNFTYTIPVVPGRYRVTLKFAETWFGPGKPGGGGRDYRIFDVYANGVALLKNFDIYKEAGGPDRALDRTFRGITPNALGKIVLSFVPVKNYASVNAIEIAEDRD